ncbi:MFAP2 protein, partial [Crotophaga sulcirostris]|nr:MFAP2 protein [Crotophaga sulcirostris]
APPSDASSASPAALLVQGQYSRFEGITYPEPVQYSQYDQQSEIQDYYDYHDVTPRAPEEQFRYQSQQQSQQEIVPAPTPGGWQHPHHPVVWGGGGPLMLPPLFFPTSMDSFFPAVPTADLCRDKFSKCGVMATSGLCQTVGASCARSCGGC